MELTYTIPDAESGRTVYTVLKNRLRMSAGLIRRLKAAQAITVDGKREFSNYVLSAGQILNADLAAAEPESGIVPERAPLDIIFEDGCILAVNKPAGVFSHPTRSRHTGTMANYVSGYLQDTSGHAFCHAVNRLDRDTSGVMIFAKNSHYKALFGSAMRAAGTVKEYIALLHGKLPGDIVVDRPIRRAGERELLREVSPEGKRAVTRCKLVGSACVGGEPVSLVRLRLETGRTHQIRVHMLDLGFPVLGDGLYSTDRSAEASKKLSVSLQALHAFRVVISHPVTGTEVEIRAKLNRPELDGIISEVGRDFIIDINRP
jgi:23S rRNA pseudouridine1911/1915/1917 synthase